jgi:chemotaxis protein methyltransferase CheR
MVVRENVELAGWEVKIRGVDVNPAMIAKGRAARYSEWSLREIDPEIKRRYFRQQRREFHLQDRIREMVSLEEGNLADEHAVFWQPSTYDVIFFRNVLMYFSPQAGSTIVARMAESIVPGGYLFLGPAETLRAVSQDFHLCHTHGAFYYQRRNGVPNARADRTAKAVSQTAPAAVDQLAESGTDWIAAINQASDRVEKLTRTAKYVQATPQRAKSHKDAATKHTPADISTVLQLLQRERFEEALAALPEITDKSRANADVQLLRAVLLANSGALAEAEHACLALLKEDDLNAGAHYIMALCKEYTGSQHSAVEHDQIAVYLDPSFAMPHLHLGLLSKRSGNLSTARQELHQASLLLAREDSSRILLFGGGFSREALAALCRNELQGCGGPA